MLLQKGKVEPAEASQVIAWTCLSLNASSKMYTASVLESLDSLYEDHESARFFRKKVKTCLLNLINSKRIFLRYCAAWLIQAGATTTYSNSLWAGAAQLWVRLQLLDTAQTHCHGVCWLDFSVSLSYDYFSWRAEHSLRHDDKVSDDEANSDSALRESIIVVSMSSMQSS